MTRQLEPKQVLIIGLILCGLQFGLALPYALQNQSQDKTAKFIVSGWTQGDGQGTYLGGVYRTVDGQYPDPVTDYVYYASSNNTFSVEAGSNNTLLLSLYINQSLIDASTIDEAFNYFNLSMTIENPSTLLYSFVKSNFTSVYNGTSGDKWNFNVELYLGLEGFFPEELTIYTLNIEYSVIYGDFLDGWTKVRAIPITGSSGAGSNYPILLDFRPDVEMQVDLDDLRFYSEDNTTLLNAWLQENDIYSGRALVWVNVEANLDTDQTIFMYYGNPTASAYWNGEATFSFFDDFNDGSFDSSKWTITSSGGSYTETGGYLTVKGPQPERIDSKEAFGNGYAFCYQNVTVTAKAANKFVYFGCWNTTASDIYGFQSSNNVYQYGTYNTAYETTAAAGWASQLDYGEIQAISGSKNEYFEDFVSKASHSTQTTTTQKFIDFYVTGSGVGSGDYVTLSTVFVRKCIDTEPVTDVGDWTTIEDFTGTAASWHEINNIDVIFDAEISASTLWAMDGYFMFGGAIMVVFSTTYAAYRIKSHSGEYNDVAIVAILFIVGWALIIRVVI